MAEVLTRQQIKQLAAYLKKRKIPFSSRLFEIDAKQIAAIRGLMPKIVLHGTEYRTVEIEMPDVFSTDEALKQIGFDPLPIGLGGASSPSEKVSGEPTSKGKM